MKFTKSKLIIYLKKTAFKFNNLDVCCKLTFQISARDSDERSFALKHHWFREEFRHKD